MMTMAKLKSVLSADEPIYSQTAKLDAEAFRHLRSLVGGADPLIAAKAIYFGSLTGGKESEDLLRAGASNPEPTVRVAVAGAARNLPLPSRDSLILTLLDDGDCGVMRTALNSVAAHPTHQLRKKVRDIANRTEDSALRDLATSILQDLQTK